LPREIIPDLVDGNSRLLAHVCPTAMV
jgi:hypothetical protein